MVFISTVLRKPNDSKKNASPLFCHGLAFITPGHREPSCVFKSLGGYSVNQRPGHLFNIFYFYLISR